MTAPILRSVVYQLDRLVRHLAELPDRSSSPGSRHDEQLVRQMTTILRRTDAQRLAAVDPEADQRSSLDSVLGEVDGLLGELLDSRGLCSSCTNGFRFWPVANGTRWNRPCEVPDRPLHSLPLQRARIALVAMRPIFGPGTRRMSTVWPTT